MKNINHPPYLLASDIVTCHAGQQLRDDRYDDTKSDDINQYRKENKPDRSFSVFHRRANEIRPIF